MQKTSLLQGQIQAKGPNIIIHPNQIHTKSTLMYFSFCCSPTLSTCLNPSIHQPFTHINSLPHNVLFIFMPVYVNHLLGGSINEGVYQMQYFYQTSKFIFTSGGISPQEAENLICFNFEVVWYSNVKEAIDEGAVVFSSICNGTHSVAIMGYTNSQEYVYYDPMHINWRVADYSNFINSYNIPVIGIKNNK